ncbi:MAG: recognition motif protein [Armatimonadetes bacterium]|nr:recognition motif protein [Armatimonadota bacterium]
MSKRLFVGNLSFDVSEAELQETFAPYGSSGATIPTTDSGKPKGFGFVDIPSEKVEDAISGMDGKELHGRNIAVAEAKPRPEVSHWGNSSGRSYGGGGRGGFGGNRGGGGGGGGRRW